MGTKEIEKHRTSRGHTRASRVRHGLRFDFTAISRHSSRMINPVWLTGRSQDESAHLSPFFDLTRPQPNSEHVIVEGVMAIQRALDQAYVTTLLATPAAHARSAPHIHADV